MDVSYEFWTRDISLGQLLLRCKGSVVDNDEFTHSIHK